MRITRQALKSAVSLAALFALAPAAAAWSQTPPAPAPAATPIPSFPPASDYAGVAGSAAENTRITGLCGANRNAKDGYFAAPLTPDQTRAPLTASGRPLKVDVVATLDRSIGLTFLPSGRMLVSQRAGGMRTVDAAGVVSEPLAGTPAVRAGGLSAVTDVLLDRDFAKNRTLYYGYVVKAEPGAAPGPALGRIVKATLSADERAIDNVVTLHEVPDLTPRRIVQARDGTLLIAAAEVASGGPNPQSLTVERGKVLRIATDGSIPKNNPYLSNPQADPALYAVGFRDIQGAALNPKTGDLWVGENEPMGGDEVNRVLPGKNYGFPLISYGRENSGALIDGGKTADKGLEQPVYYWTPSIAPSGLAFYTGDRFKDWKGDLLVGGMSGKQLVHLKMKGGRVVGEEKLLMERCKRTKDVRQGPDGLIYVMTDEPKSEILRLSPG
ncbi:PQQ-dependent sugar dehydrogenase [soil metagenome]